MSQYWIVVAEAAQARLFSRSKKFSEFEELDSLVHPESRLPGRELERDRPGVGFKSHGPGADVKNKPTDPKRREAMEFAARLANVLRQARMRGDYQRLILVADPGFLGLLRANLDDATASVTELEITKNIVRRNVGDIRQAVDAALRE